MVERFHRRLKESLIALGNESPDDWYWRLPCSMLAIRTTLKPDLGASPADLVYGEGLAVPGELLPSNPATEPQLVRQREAALADMRIHVARLQPVQTSAHRRPLVHLPDELQTCTHVFVRRGGYQSSLSSPYVGPYKVLDRNETNFKVDIPGRAKEVVNIARVKPAFYSVEDPEESAPTARQRPSSQSPRPQRRRRNRPRTRRTCQEQDQQPLPQSPPQSPPIHRHVPRGRARPLRSDDDDDDVEQPPASPRMQPHQDDTHFPLDYDVPVDQVPQWDPPDWFDQGGEDGVEPEEPPPPRLPQAGDDLTQDPVRNWGDIPPPDAPPPPPPSRRRKQGNPNWVKGGSFAGRFQRNFARPNAVSGPEADDEPESPRSPPVTRQRRKPDVSAILAHLGIPSTASPSCSVSHVCSSGCDEVNDSNSIE